MAERNSAETFRSPSGLFAAAFVAGLIVLALLGNFGLPDIALGTTLGVGVIVAFALAGVSERTMQATEFHSAGGGISAMTNGIASAAAFLSAGAILGLANAFLHDFRLGIAIVLGWCFGFLLLAILIAPYLRKSGALSIGDFLAIRYGGRLIRLVAALIVAATLVPALAAAIATGTLVTSRLFTLSPQSAGAVVIALVLSGTVLGGMRAVTLTALAQYIVLAIAFLVPVAVLSTIAYSLPLPQLAVGFALEDGAALATSGDLAASPIGQFAPQGGLQLLATAISLAAGVAVLPQLLLRTATVSGVAATRRSAGWSLAFVLVVAMAVPAYVAFARLAILRDLVGTAIEDLPDWLFVLGQRGLVMLCGADAASVTAARAACIALNGSAGPVAAPDLAISGDAIILAWGDLVGLPYVATALIAVGTLAAALAAANMMALAVAGALGHDVYGRLINAKASVGRGLIVTRLLLIGTVLGAAMIGAKYPRDVSSLAFVALSLSAGGLFPAVVLAVWWKGATRWGAIAGMIAGFATTAAILAAIRFPGVLPVSTDALGLSELSAPIVGLPVGFLVALAVSLATKKASQSQEAVIDAIRRPGSPLTADIQT